MGQNDGWDYIRELKKIIDMPLSLYGGGSIVRDIGYTPLNFDPMEFPTVDNNPFDDPLFWMAEASD